ncbi:hypothetical protein HK100_007402, partial [Physocladia obscura]
MGPNVSRLTEKRSKTSKAEGNNVQSKIIDNTESSVSSDAVELVSTIDDKDFTRQYHGVEESDYFLPSDSGEQSRLEIQ